MLRAIVCIIILQVFITPAIKSYANDKNNFSVKVNDKIKLIPGTPDYEDYMNQEHLHDMINSQRAWIYSAIIPGLGQIHNNQYVHAGVIWGALISVGAGAYYCHNQYVKFSHENNDGSFVKTYKKVRDSLLFVGLLCYIANIFDAYVGAELAKFDISDDVSVQVVPNFHKSAYSDASIGFTIDFSLM